jgi:hypothetical protein
VTGKIQVVTVECGVIEEISTINVDNEFVLIWVPDKLIDDVIKFVYTNALSRTIGIGPADGHVKDKYWDLGLVVSTGALSI